MMITVAIISSFTGPDSIVLHQRVYAVLMLPSITTSFHDNSLYNLSRNLSELLVFFFFFPATMMPANQCRDNKSDGER